MKYPIILYFLLFPLLNWGSDSPEFNNADLIKTDTLILRQELQRGEQLLKFNADSAFNISKNVFVENDRLLNKQGKSKGSYPLKGDALYQMGESSRYKGVYRDARQYFDSALTIYQQFKIGKGIADCYHSFGNISYLSSDYQMAKAYYLQAIEMKKKLDLPLEAAKTMSNLGSVYFRTGESDSAMNYQQESYDIRRQFNDSLGMSSSLINMGNIYLYQTNLPKAVECYSQALTFIDTTLITRDLATIVNNLGNVYNRQGNYSKALLFYQQALKIYEGLGDKKGSAFAYNNAALIHFETNNFTQALDYHLKALSLMNELGDKNGISDSYFYLGRIYHQTQDYQNAMAHFFKALAIKKKINDVNGMADCYQNIGVIHQDLRKNDSALFYFRKSMITYTNSSNRYGEATALNNIATLFLSSKRYEKAFSYAKECYSLARSYGGLMEQMDATLTMSRAKEKLGNTGEALSLFKQYNQLKDSIFDQDKTKAILELEAKYQTEKKQNEIENQNLLLAKRELEIQSAEQQYILQKKIRNLLILTASILILLLIWIGRNLFSIKKMNQTLKIQKRETQEKNNELEKLNVELEAQRDRIEEQNTILLEQKNQLEIIHRHLTGSIQYAEYIQRAVLPSETYMKSILKESFVLYQPKEAVGGDFYWVHESNNRIFVALGDCTGHGVPGGFLTMLGISFLKEIANSLTSETLAGEILDKLRTLIIESLHQKGAYAEQADGIDMALTIFDKNKNQLQFAGARGIGILLGANDTTLLKGDRMSLSFSPRMNEFNTQFIEFNPNDIIYLYTDGFVDQFNSENEKFGRRRLIDLCLKEHQKPFNKQKEIFYQTFMDWKGNFEQIDDAMVLAYKLKMS